MSNSVADCVVSVKLEQVRESVPYLVSRVAVGLTPMASPPDREPCKDYRSIRVHVRRGTRSKLKRICSLPGDP